MIISDEDGFFDFRHITRMTIQAPQQILTESFSD